jgi:hypothetical protein
MLVEDHDRNKLVACLLCKTNIKVGSDPRPPGSGKTSRPPRK